MPAAIPIVRYKIVQTGVNNQLGGVNPGLSRVAYQVFAELLIAKADKAPIRKQTAMEIKILIMSFLVMVIYVISF